MRSRSTVFLTRLANVASLALAVQLGMAAPDTFTQAPPWLHGLLLVTVACTVLSFSMTRPARARWVPDVVLLVLCALQQVFWLAFAPAALASTLPWSWAIWLSASIVVTFRHGTWLGVLFAMAGVLSYPVSLALLGRGLSDSSAVALLVPLFLAPVPPMFEQLRRELDALRAAEISSAETSASAANASSRLRSQLDTSQAFAAFVHDNVLGALAAAANTAGPVSEKLRELARRALDGLGTRDAQDARPLTQIRVLHDELAAVAAESGATWTAALPRDAMPTVPVGVARDFAAAFRQAAENSVVHADKGTRAGAVRSARLLVTGGTLELQYRDDGPGFVLAEVPGDRLGLRGSILHRIERHDGATAVVDTTPGAGTVVTLRWTNPERGPGGAPVAARVLRAGGAASALLAFWLISVVISLTTIDVQSQPLWTVAANVLVGAGAVCLAFGRRLTPALTWGIASLPFVTSLLLLPQADPTMPKWQFTLDAASMLCAYLIVRGRVIPGALGYGTMAVVGLFWAWMHGGFHMLQGPRWLPTIMIGVALIWWWRLRRERASVLALRREEALALRRLDDASVALEGVEQQRAWVSSAARDTLEEIAGATVLATAQRERARLAEARIRDRMRSPALSIGALEQAIGAARSRGAKASVLDDGAAAGHLPQAAVDQVVAHLSPAGRGDVVTVRRAPSQRVSVFVQHGQAPGKLSFVTWTDDEQVAPGAGESGQ